MCRDWGTECRCHRQSGGGRRLRDYRERQTDVGTTRRGLGLHLPPRPHLFPFPSLVATSNSCKPSCTVQVCSPTRCVRLRLLVILHSVAARFRVTVRACSYRSAYFALHATPCNMWAVRWVSFLEPVHTEGACSPGIMAARSPCVRVRLSSAGGRVFVIQHCVPARSRATVRACSYLPSGPVCRE